MAPSNYIPTPGQPGSTRMRVRWENLMIVLIGVVVATFVVVGILASGAEDTPTTADADKPAAPALAQATEPAIAADELTLEDSQSLVEEARTLMSEARWDEAIDRLDTIPEDLREIAGAATLRTELDETRASYEELRGQVDAAIEARRYAKARALLAQLVGIAKHDSSLIELGVTIDDAEIADRAPAAADGEQSATASGGGTKASKSKATTAKPAAAASGATSTAKPSATKPKPKPAKQPAATGGGANAAPSADQSVGDVAAANGLTQADLAAITQAAGVDAGSLMSSLSESDLAALNAALAQLQ